MQNKFLDDFIRRQTQVIQSTVEHVEPVSRDKKGRKKSRHGTADGRAPFGEEDEFTRICNEKPSRRHVIAYFRNRVAELVAADME